MLGLLAGIGEGLLLIDVPVALQTQGSASAPVLLCERLPGGPGAHAATCRVSRALTPAPWPALCRKQRGGRLLARPLAPPSSSLRRGRPPRRRPMPARPRRRRRRRAHTRRARARRPHRTGRLLQEAGRCQGRLPGARRPGSRRARRGPAGPACSGCARCWTRLRAGLLASIRRC